MVGSFRLSARQVVCSLLGLMDNEPSTSWSRTCAVPHGEAALAVGLALGLAGTIFQQLLRNPLASPDFVGISSGAALAAVAASCSTTSAAWRSRRSP